MIRKKKLNLENCFCPRCFEMTTLNSEGDNLKCSLCGMDFQKHTYQLLFDFALNSVNYGWGYRNTYEQDLEKNKNLDSKYAIEFFYDHLYNLAMFVVQMVIAGYGWDIIKDKAKNFHDKYKNKYKKYEQLDEEFDKFIRYMEEYSNDNMSCDSKVTSAIYEEEDVDVWVDIMQNGIDEDYAKKLLEEDDTFKIDQMKKYHPSHRSNILMFKVARAKRKAVKKSMRNAILTLSNSKKEE